MRKLIFVLALAATLAACEKEVGFVVDPLATINLKPVSSAWNAPAMGVKSNNGYLSALDIVRKTTVIHFTMKDGASATRSFEPLQRDTVSATPMLKMWGTDIIKEDGSMEYGFIEAKDIVLEIWRDFPNLPYNKSRVDTIAYIPNTVLRAAENAIKAAYMLDDSEACYSLFNDAFTFLPITGVQYKQLKEKGLN